MSPFRPGGRLAAVEKAEDIFPAYRGTPAGLLLEYHNLGRPFDRYDRAQILIGMCMDNRKHLNIPDFFAYILRTGGGNMRHSEFRMSYAVAVGGVKAVALIGHTNCGMRDLHERKAAFIQGLVDNGGWSEEKAREHFDRHVLLHEIGDEVDFIANEAQRIRDQYPKVLVAPMIFRVEDSRLYLVHERKG